MSKLDLKKPDNKKMICKGCAFVYSPKHGDPESNIVPYTNFNEIPEEWKCPICDASKDKFEEYEDDI